MRRRRRSRYRLWPAPRLGRLTASGADAEPIDLYPNPLPPPGPPVTRDSTLADLQTGFASLTDNELKARA